MKHNLKFVIRESKKAVKELRNRTMSPERGKAIAYNAHNIVKAVIASGKEN